MPTWYLVGGLAAVFVGMVDRDRHGRRHRQGALAGRRPRWRRSRPSAARSPTTCDRQYDQPFDARVTKPPQAWLANGARTLAGANWAKNTARRLDMAGNPSALGRRADPGGQGRRGDRARRRWRVLLIWLSGRTWSALLWGVVFAVAGLLPARPAPDEHRPEAVGPDPEGAARQHRPAHHLRGVRAGVRRSAGPGRPQHRGPTGRGVHPRAPGDPDRLAAGRTPSRPWPTAPASTTCASS